MTLRDVPRVILLLSSIEKWDTKEEGRRGRDLDAARERCQVNRKDGGRGVKRDWKSGVGMCLNTLLLPLPLLPDDRKNDPKRIEREK